MQTLEQVLNATDPRRATETLTLVFELRRRARLRARLDSGKEVGLLLQRGLSLVDGDRLASADGALVVLVQARPELLSTVETADPHLLTRAAYHLGNRHVPLQIGPGRLAYQHDHVLDGLMAELGLAVKVVEAPFEPEPGGYSGGHRHHDDEQQGDDHSHDRGHHHHGDDRAHAQHHHHGHE